MHLFRKKLIFNEEQNERMVEAIREAEKMTSGEIRIYIELKCRFVDPMDRALEIFNRFDIKNTKNKNGVLIYVAVRDRQFALLGDKGIDEKVGPDFWKKQASLLKQALAEKRYIPGICATVRSIGESLKKHFPYREDDENELPDDIIYG